MSAQEAMPVMNGASGPDSDGYNHWSEMKSAQPKSLSPPQPQKQLSDSYSNTLPVRKNVPPKNSYASGEVLSCPSPLPVCWLCRSLGPVVAAVSRVSEDAGGAGTGTGHISASGPGRQGTSRAGVCCGVLGGFQPTDGTRREFLRGLAQGGCSRGRG